MENLVKGLVLEGGWGGVWWGYFKYQYPRSEMEWGQKPKLFA